MSWLKTIARECAAELYARSPGRLRNLQGKVTILTYHRVLSAEELRRQYVQPGMYVLREVFDSHVRFLKQHFRGCKSAAKKEGW